MAIRKPVSSFPTPSAVKLASKLAELLESLGLVDKYCAAFSNSGIPFEVQREYTVLVSLTTTIVESKLVAKPRFLECEHLVVLVRREPARLRSVIYSSNAKCT